MQAKLAALVLLLFAVGAVSPVQPVEAATVDLAAVQGDPADPTIVPLPGPKRFVAEPEDPAKVGFIAEPEDPDLVCFVLAVNGPIGVCATQEDFLRQPQPLFEPSPLESGDDR